MPLNVLYRIVKEITSKKADSKATLRTHPNGNPYYLFDFPVKDKTTIGSYRLTSHHLSVNEVPQGKYDEASQCHYTAYFVDEKKQEYRLHIFYDAQDDCVSAPLLTIMTKDKTFKDVESQECHEGFKKLALDSMNALITSIRKDQTDKVKSLLTEYDELEKKATELSIDLVQNKEAYLLIIKRQSAILEELPLYANKRQGIVRNIPYLKRVRTAVESQVPLEATAVAVVQKPDVADSKQTKSDSLSLTTHKKEDAVVQAATAAAAPPKVNAGKTEKKKTGLSQDIIALKAKVDLRENPTALLAHLVFMEFEIDAGAYSPITLRNIQALQELRKKIEQNGTISLALALRRGQFDIADDLSAFYEFLPDSIITLALTTYNSKLLEQLIKKKFLSINYTNFEVAGENFNSLVEYFFVCTIYSIREKTVAPSVGITTTHIKEITECFNVLVQYGASLFSKDSIYGMPYAAMILIDAKHPFYAVLQKHPQTTIANPAFYERMNQMLHPIIKQSQCSTKLKKCLSNLVMSNSEIAYALRLNKIKSTEKVLEGKEVNTTKQINDVVGAELIALLDSDPEFSALKNAVKTQDRDIAIQIARFFPKMSRAIFTASYARRFKVLAEKLTIYAAQPNCISLAPEIKKIMMQKYMALFHSGNLITKFFEVFKEGKACGNGTSEAIKQNIQDKLAKCTADITADILENAKEYDKPFSLSDSTFFSPATAATGTAADDDAKDVKSARM